MNFVCWFGVFIESFQFLRSIFLDYLFFTVMGVELHEFGLMIMVINKYRNCFIICWCCEFMGMGKPQKLSHHKVYPTTGGFIKILVIRFLNNWAWIQFPVDWSSVWHNCLSGLENCPLITYLTLKKAGIQEHTFWNHKKPKLLLERNIAIKDNT